MEGGSKLFRGEVPFVMIIDGTVNGGSKFHVEGKGSGNAQEGYQRGKWVCKSGKMPVPWSLLAPTLGYGFLVFAKYPNGIKNFPVESFPEGVTYDRTLTFENDGVITSHHDIFWQKGQVMNKVTFTAEGFKPDSPVINFGIGVPKPSVATCYPNGNNSGRYIVPQVFPIKDSDQEVVYASMVTNVKGIGTSSNIKYGMHHFIKGEQEQFKDVSEKSDHICQHEALTVFDFSLLEAFTKKQE